MNKLFYLLAGVTIIFGTSMGTVIGVQARWTGLASSAVYVITVAYLIACVIIALKYDFGD